MATNLNLKRRGALGSGCQASTLARNFTTKMKTIITTLLTLVFAFSASADEANESPQISAARTINKLLVAGKFEDVYRDWCHPHLQKQVDKEGFVKSMKEAFGKGVIKIFADVVKAIDDRAGPDVIVAQPQEDKDEYEFILAKVRKNNPIGSKGSPWHIELKLDEGKWKLMDTD
jgi:ABC-type transporter MlaC component